MGRFYKTALPRFERGITHKTPWELASKVLEKKEGEVNTMFANAELLEGSTANMNYLAFEKDKAAEIQDKYAARVDEITQQIQEDPMNAAKYQPALRTLKRDLQKDRMRGEWGNLESRYAAVQKWQKDNEELRKKEPGNYRLAQATFMKRLEEGVAEDPEAQWGGYDLVARPDLKGEETRQRFENIKANIMEQRGPNGMYLYKGEEVGQDRVAAIAMNELMSDPNFGTYLQQQKDILGDEKFSQMGFDQPMFTEDGKGGMTINPNNPFARDVSNAASTYGYKELTMTADPYGLENYKQGNRMRLLQAKHKLDNEKELFPKALVQQTSQVFSKDQLKDVFYNVYMPGKKNIAEGKDPTTGMDPQQAAYYKKMSGMYDNALASTPGMNEDLLKAYEMTNAPDEEKYVTTYSSGMPTVMDLKLERTGAKTTLKPEYARAEKIVAQNKETIDKFNKNLADSNTKSFSVLPIDETESDIGKMYAGEMNQLLSTGAIKAFSPDYLPWKYDNIGNVQPMEISGDGDIGTNFIADVAAAEGITPFEAFAEGSVRRYRRGNKTYYTGRLKPKLITNYGLEAAGNGNFDGEVTIEVPQAASNVDQMMLQKYQHNPDMYHAYKMGTDNGYQSTFERMDMVLNMMNNIEGSNTSPTFNVDRNPNPFKLTLGESGYQLYMERPTGEVLVDRIAVPVYNEAGEVVGSRDEMIGNSQKDIFQALNYFNNNPGSYVDPDDED